MLLDGAKQRATDTGDLETLHADEHRHDTLHIPGRISDLEIQKRLTAMRDDLTVCLAVLYNPQAGKPSGSIVVSGMGGFLPSNALKQIEALLVEAFNHHL